MTNRDLRLQAKRLCKGKGELVFTYFIYELILSFIAGLSSTGVVFAEESAAIASTTSSVASVVMAVLAGPLYIGFVQAIKDNIEGIPAELKTLFTHFKQVGKKFAISILVSLYSFLWSLLFVIPGIVATFAYSMAYYIHMDDNSLSANECIKKSKEMMKGHKWQLFCLRLSYIGWILLSFLTIGILLFWIVPKMETAQYLFYQSLKGEGTQKIVEE